MNVVVAYLKTPQHCFGAIEEHEDIPVGRFDGLVKRPNLGPPICATELLIILDPPVWSCSWESWRNYWLPQGRIKLFGAPRQWKHSRPLFQAVFLSGGVLPTRQSNTTPPSPKTEITNILLYIEPFYYQLMHIMLKNTELLKHSKITLRHVSVYIETIFRELKSVLG